MPRAANAAEMASLAVKAGLSSGDVLGVVVTIFPLAWAVVISRVTPV